MAGALRSWGFAVAVAALCPPLAAAPDPAAAAVQAAALLYSHGDYDGALDRLDALSPTAAPGPAFEGALLRGLVRLRQGRPGDAVPPLQRAASLRPGDPDALLNLGLAFQQSGRWQEAGSAYEEARRAQPRRPEPLLGLGGLAAGRGDWAEAERLDRAALALDGADPGAWRALADALVERGDLRGAVDARDRALALRPGDDELRFRQAVALYTLGDLDRAAAALERSHPGDRPEAYLLEGSLAYRRGDLDGAQRRFEAALEARPGYPEARLNLGITLGSRQRYEEALEQFRRIGGRDAVGAAARDYERQTLAAAVEQALRAGADAVLAGDFPGAVQHWQHARELSPDKAPIDRMIESLRRQQGPRADWLALQGEQALGRGDLAAALQSWNEALRIDPKNRRALDGMRGAGKDLARLKAAYEEAGRRLLDQDQVAGARTWAESLDKVSPGAGAGLLAQVKAAVERRLKGWEAEAARAQAAGRPEEALAFYDQGLALDPGNPRLQARRRAAEGAVHRKAGALLAEAGRLEAGGSLKAAFDRVQDALALEPESLEARREHDRLAKRLDLKQLSAQAVDDLYYRGVYLYGNGDTAGALALWRQGLEAAPRHRPLLQAVRAAEAKLKSLARLEGK